MKRNQITITTKIITKRKKNTKDLMLVYFVLQIF